MFLVLRDAEVTCLLRTRHRTPGTSSLQRKNGLNSPRSMQHTFMKRLSIRITFVIIALAAATAVVIGDLERHAAGRKLREAILAELQPVALKNCTLKRFGSANDGGYLKCENLIEPLDAGYSYGV